VTFFRCDGQVTVTVTVRFMTFVIRIRRIVENDVFGFPKVKTVKWLQLTDEVG